MLPRRVSLAASFEAAGESNSSSRSPGKATGLLRLWIEAGAACIFQNIVFESSCVTSLVVVFRLPEKDKRRKEHDSCCQLERMKRWINRYPLQCPPLSFEYCRGLLWGELVQGVLPDCDQTFGGGQGHGQERLSPEPAQSVKVRARKGREI